MNPEYQNAYEELLQHFHCWTTNFADSQVAVAHSSKTNYGLLHLRAKALDFVCQQACEYNWVSMRLYDFPKSNEEVHLCLQHRPHQLLILAHQYIHASLFLNRYFYLLLVETSHHQVENHLMSQLFLRLSFYPHLLACVQIFLRFFYRPKK